MIKRHMQTAKGMATHNRVPINPINKTKMGRTRNQPPLQSGNNKLPNVAWQAQTAAHAKGNTKGV